MPIASDPAVYMPPPDLVLLNPGTTASVLEKMLPSGWIATARSSVEGVTLALQSLPPASLVWCLLTGIQMRLMDSAGDRTYPEGSPDPRTTTARLEKILRASGPDLPNLAARGLGHQAEQPFHQPQAGLADPDHLGAATRHLLQIIRHFACGERMEAEGIISRVVIRLVMDVDRNLVEDTLALPLERDPKKYQTAILQQQKALRRTTTRWVATWFRIFPKRMAVIQKRN